MATPSPTGADTTDAVREGDGRWDRERAAMGAVHGAGSSDRFPAYPQVRPFSRATVETLFGEVWNRPGMPLRDRRLLVLGAVSMVGRGDLVTVRALGGLRSGDFTDELLRGAVLQLAFYCGWLNATAVEQGVMAALEAYAAETDDSGAADSERRQEG
jgi:alkylhydroperoxidase/carboxymuconolactone decarboxylase family protein YurZ